MILARPFPHTSSPSLLVDALTSPAYVEGVSRLVAEAPAVVEKTLRAAVPALLSGMAGHANDRGGKVSRLIDTARFSGDLLPGITDAEKSVEHMRAGAEMIRDIFGIRSGRLIEAVARHAGISERSANAILSVSAPLVVDALKRLGAQSDAEASLTWLGGQRNAIAELLPADISTMTGLGGGLLAAGTPRTVSAARVSAPRPGRSTAARSRKRLVLASLVVLGLVLAATAVYLTQGKKTPSGRPMIALSLPNKTTVHVSEGGFHQALYTFLERGDRTLPKLFVCDPIDFYPDSARLTPSALAAVDSLAAILNAYPGVRFRIDAFGSSSDDDDARKYVALDRMRAVAARLEAGGVEARRMEPIVYTSSEMKPGRGERALRLTITKVQ